MPVKSKMAAHLARGTATAPKAPPHLIVEARAGSGKTTTLVEGLKVVKGLPTSITPSPQQKAVWDSMALSRDARTVGFVAFNKSIADELGRRVPAGCEAMTMHSLGLKAVTARLGRLRINQYKLSDIISRLLGMDPREVRRTFPGLEVAVKRLVGLCKMNLLTDEQAADREAVEDLAFAYGVDLEDVADPGRVFELVPRVLAECRNPDRLQSEGIDFDDMVWLPVALDLPVRKFDLLLVDEAQDLNRCQQELAVKAGKRLVLCGDPRQAIYGFAGADSRSMERMGERLGATVLPLTVTRRCGRAIVAEANKIVPDFQAHESNPDGRVDRSLMCGKKVPAAAHYRLRAKEGDMVLCRANAPLVSECFGFIRSGVKANIQGRDVGQGLISTVTRLKATSVPDLVGKVDDWAAVEVRKEEAKRNPDENKIQAIYDRAECLQTFCDGVSLEGENGVREVIRRIEEMFTDDKNAPGVKLSSVHKAKGLEAHRVFLLQPKGKEVIPAWLARKSPMDNEQARNLLYVAVTRAIDELYLVYGVEE